MALEILPHGHLTTPAGFSADGLACGIKPSGLPDLALLVSAQLCAAAAVYTTNKVQGAALQVCRNHMAQPYARAVIGNAGVANDCTGERGLQDAYRMAQLAAARVGCDSKDVLVASTGVIGKFIPMDRLEEGLGRLEPAPDGGMRFLRAMMTTDTREKHVAVRFGEGLRYTLGGVCKGAGMIHPNMATMLAFLTTDAPADPFYLQQQLSRVVDRSFNMVSIDGDTSPSDCVLLLANGVKGGDDLGDGSPDEADFERALEVVCTHLSRSIAQDGEGATRLIEVNVTGARTEDEARLAARTITTSPLVKTAVHGADPNWGRIVAAAGRSGAELVEEKASLQICGILTYEKGLAVPFDEAEASLRLKEAEVRFDLELGLGAGRATAWGCDLSDDYVHINADYTT
jgi:glutamate N-acetyltransferase/amino-acid N-acetyltransferase